MKRLLIIILIFSSNVVCFAQNDIYTDIQGKKVSYFVALEQKNRSPRFHNDETYISLNQDLAQPIIYRRKQQVIPDLLVFYTFSKTDSLIEHILYEWDIRNFEKDEPKKSLEHDVLLIKKYSELLNAMTKQYGKSATEGSLTDLSQIEKEDGLARSDNWEPNDSVGIQLYTYISNYEEKGSPEIRHSHRIRLYLYNLKKKAQDGDNAAQVATANANFQAFMSKLKIDDFIVAKTYLADKTSAKTTDAQLKTFKDLVKFTENIKVFNQIFQVIPNGPIHLVLQYKYENDLENPPLAIIEVSFDGQQKLLGATPLKRQQRN
jgi:hypothetical protein